MIPTPYLSFKSTHNDIIKDEKHKIQHVRETVQRENYINLHSGMISGFAENVLMIYNSHPICDKEN